jgi:hypothetical protein
MGLTKTQFRALPAKIAPIASSDIGADINKDRGSNCLRGPEDRRDQTTLSIKRVEYLAVRPVARKKRLRKKKLVGENRENSRIRSLE